MRTICCIFVLFALLLPLHASEGVILLHGLCKSSASMNKMAAALVGAGYYVENVDYPSRTASIATLSDAAIDRALADPKMQACSRIDFVTHSLGGILVRSYFRRHDLAKLGRVVMLGPPNRGSEVVDRLGNWWLFRKLTGPAGSELGTDPDSTPNMLGPAHFELGVIAGDRSINWINSLMIKGQNDGKVSVERTKVAGMKELLVVHVPHPFLMRNKTAIGYTLSFLKYGHFMPSCRSQRRFTLSSIVSRSIASAPGAIPVSIKSSSKPQCRLDIQRSLCRRRSLLAAESQNAPTAENEDRGHPRNILEPRQISDGVFVSGAHQRGRHQAHDILEDG